MEADMSETGNLIKLMAMELCSIQTETNMRGIGWKTKLKEKAIILILMGQGTQDTG